MKRRLAQGAGLASLDCCDQRSISAACRLAAARATIDKRRSVTLRRRRETSAPPRARPTIVRTSTVEPSARSAAIRVFDERVALARRRLAGDLHDAVRADEIDARALPGAVDMTIDAEAVGPEPAPVHQSFRDITRDADDAVLDLHALDDGRPNETARRGARRPSRSAGTARRARGRERMARVFAVARSTRVRRRFRPEDGLAGMSRGTCSLAFMTTRDEWISREGSTCYPEHVSSRTCRAPLLRIG